MRGGLTYGIDFTGGTIILMKFNETPDLDRIRESLSPETRTPPLIQRYDAPSKNMVQVRIQSSFNEEEDLEAGRNRMLDVLRKVFDPDNVGSKLADFNNVGLDVLFQYLIEADPDGLAADGKGSLEIEQYYREIAQNLKDYRDKDREGLVPAISDLKEVPGVTAATVAVLEKGFYTGSFAVKGHESVGAVVGADLRNRATLAVLLSFAGMLVYVGFRFKFAYGIAAVIALIHDLAITIGLFALTNKEISLTVIAALLTLVGYSMNDSIVVFDRVRENLRLVRKEPYVRILNLSINQTFSRTVMTSGMTFLSVLALLVFGGEVLNGFSFALTIGIIIGTYSSIGIATPIVAWWYRSRELKPKRKTA
ncbi:MAG: protein translocase subunit SecF [Acidobacteria bacterium]|nr:protein translocase subunit SecF [Acidobacteriota bacterium]